MSNSPTDPPPSVELLRAAYAAFNSRDIDAALALMTQDVAWPRAFKGGFVRGPDEVRAYWTEQWSEIDPHVEPVAFRDEGFGRIVVTVHQVVRDLAGELLADVQVDHRFTIKDGLIHAMAVWDPSITRSIDGCIHPDVFMNRDIQLHDCEVAAIHHIDGSTSVVLSTAYIHASLGLPGFDPGVIWTQVATITIIDAAQISQEVCLPIWIYHGTLRVGETLYEGFIPAGGHLLAETELVLTLSTEDGRDGGTFTVKGNGVRIELLGERSEVEEFNETPRRSVD
ncbi:hypothetical protein BGE01nite_05220 [Brevifollis gellanilyticus]|uniref:SnoaL-like domain-containing protein n=1 Tax=Brevifollis gellanilyticus TaxID=748831 RepID=A0A512M4I0_9BACT|nr:nuclear transport factor 2 family protein [Brevifollis gellanilyticus]GEP41231.1 hypothetical protein BGE01nite_05220 [Brevifollis gellanilyticus]